MSTPHHPLQEEDEPSPPLYLKENAKLTSPRLQEGAMSTSPCSSKKGPSLSLPSRYRRRPSPRPLSRSSRGPSPVLPFISMTEPHLLSYSTP